MPRGLPTGKTGRRSDGTFAPGNAGGPGRPPAATVHEHRAAMVAAVTPDDVAAIMQALVAQAKAGDIAAARLVLERVFGRVTDTETLERIETLETAILARQEDRAA